jgi:tetratricopeptide (TPR) repeat protein
MLRPINILALAIMASLCSVATAKPAAAQPAEAAADDDNKRTASQHFKRGVDLYHSGDYRAALIAFKRAHETAPHFSVLYNLGQASAELKDYVSALDSFERYLKEGADDVPSERRTQVEAEIAKLRGYVASISLAVNVEGAEVLVDDVLVGKTPLGRALVVGAGRRKIAISKAGYDSVQRFVDVAGGDETDLELTLSKPTAKTTPAPEPKPQPAPETPVDEVSSTPFWVTLGFTIAAGAGTAAMGVLALQAKDDFDTALDTFGSSADAIEAKRDDVSTFAAGADVLGAVTAAAAIVTIVFAVRAYGGDDDEGAQPSTSLLIGPTTVGASVSF